MTPAPGTNQRPQEGATFGAPTPPSGALGEKCFLCPFVSSWGAPNPRSSHCSGGYPERPALSPHRDPSPEARALDSIWARQEAGEGSGAPKVRRLGRGVGRRGLTAPGPPPQPPVALDLALRAPPPNTSPHPRPASPLHALNPLPGPKSSSPAAQPRALIIVPPTGPPPDKISTRCGADRTPIIASHTSPQLRYHWTPPLWSLIQPLQSVATGPHYNASHSDPLLNPAPPQLRC